MDYADKQEALVRVFGAVHAYENDMFVVSPDRIGFALLTHPLSWIDQSVVDSWQALINLPFPEGTVLQLIMYASPDVEMTLHTFSTLRNNLEDGPIKAAIHERMKFLRQRADESLGSAAPARLRNVQCVLAVQIPTGGVEPSESKLNEMRELKQNMSSLLRGMHYDFEAMTPASYVRFMETVMNHGPEAVWRRTAIGEYDDRVLLCNQILDGDTPIHIKKDHLQFGDAAFVRVVSPKRIPEKMFAGQGFRYLADLAAGTDAMKDPVLITVNILYPNSDRRAAQIQKDNLWTTQQSEGKLARFMPELGKKKKSLDIMMQAMDNGDRPLYAYIGAAVIAPTKERSMQASTDLVSMFRRLGFQMVEDHYSAMPMFSQLIPFGASEDIKQSLLRYRTMPARAIVPMIPMFGSWQGSGTPLLTFFGRDGQLMSVSPWDTNAGYNAIVAAQTGAGKSFLANFMIENILSVQGRVWVIDKGGSYKNLCEALGGQYIEFEDDVELSLNPFTQVTNFADEIDMIAGMVEVMAAPRDGFRDLEAAEVKRVLGMVWEERGPQMTIDDLQRALLSEEDKRLQDVGRQLHSFTEKGEYGKYFYKPNTVDMSNQFVVLELQQLSARPHLQRLVLLQIMNLIQQGMHSSPRAQKKFVLVDEAFSLLASNETMNFIVGWYRQLRKHGGSACICTQSVLDLFVNDGAVAIMENSAHRYLLMQKSESIEKAKAEGKLSLGDAGFRLLRTVRTVQNEFSEVLLNTPFGTGVGRLVVSEFEKLLFSTRAEDVSSINAYRSQGMDLSQAIFRVMDDRGRSDRSGLN